MSHPLDNIVWHALTGPHAHLAIGRGKARHYPRDIAPFSAIEESTASAYGDLARDLPPNGEARLFRLSDEALPAGWEKVDAFPAIQMTARHAIGNVEPSRAVSTLSAADTRMMLELVAAAKPGPFGQRTTELGTYLGIRENGHLLAMAGERMRAPGYVELSSICTHPDARGRGLAADLMLRLMRTVLERGEVPVLHVRHENTAAISLYRRLGFEVRREFWVLTRKPSTA